MNKIITLLRKPLETTVARTVLEHGTGGMNIDASRLETEDSTSRAVSGARSGVSLNASGDGSLSQARINGGHEDGRWPANVILTESSAERLDDDIGILKSGKMRQSIEGGQFTVWGKQYPRYVETIGDEGGPSRFFKVIPDSD